MKISSLLAAGLFVVVLSHSAIGRAADPRFGNNLTPAPARGFLGLPMPQQWSGARPAAMNANYGNANYGTSGYQQAGYNANCPNGNCTTGYRGQTSNSANGSCLSASCASGNCPNGCCVNGQCLTGECRTGSCPSGNCATGTTSNYRYPVGAQSDWSPRTSRTGYADSYRRPGAYDDRNSMMQRTQRPVLAPLNDTFNSRYRQDDLNLRNEYFSNDRQSRMDSNEWSRSSRRSLEAPANSEHGIARF